jgi:uncharacterized protein (DUF697 family)
MTRKQLPKAIVRPAENVHAFGGRPVLDQEAPAAAPTYDAAEDEPALAVTSAPIANDLIPAASLDAEAPAGSAQAGARQAASRQPQSPQAKAFAAKRRALAAKIVERHRNYAALGGLVPLAVVNIASVTAINLRMVKRLSALYEVPFQRDRTRAMIISLLAGAVPTGFGAATASTLTWIVPGGLLFALGVSAVTAGALTRGIGQVFIESFESGAATSDSMPTADASSAAT